MSEGFIPTRGSEATGKNPIEFKFVTFESYKSKKAKDQDQQPHTEKSDHPAKEFNIKKAKHEVIKFGMSGFDPDKKEEAKIRLAISLGAKPPKNKYKNYKELKEERAQLKATQNNHTKFAELGKDERGKSTVKIKKFANKRRKPTRGLLDIYGKVRPGLGK